jgi:hypothetical protein
MKQSGMLNMSLQLYIANSLNNGFTLQEVARRTQHLNLRFSVGYMQYSFSFCDTEEEGTIVIGNVWNYWENNAASRLRKLQLKYILMHSSVSNIPITDAEVMTVWLHCASQPWHINWCWCDDRLITLCLSTQSTDVDVMTGWLPCASQHNQLMLVWWQVDYVVPLNKHINWCWCDDRLINLCLSTQSTDVDVMTGWLPCASQHWHVNWCWCDDRLITLCLSTLAYQLMLKWWLITLCLSTQSTDVDVMTGWLPCASQHRHINWCWSDDRLITLCL